MFKKKRLNTGKLTKTIFILLFTDGETVTQNLLIY